MILMKKCTIKGCKEKHYSNGLCQKHYMQERRGTLTEERRTSEDIMAELSQYKQEIHNLAEIFKLLSELIEKQ